MCVSMLGGWCLLALLGAAAAQTPLPELDAAIIDRTQTLSAAERQAIEARIAAYENSSGGQLQVIMVDSTGDESIKAYALRAFNTSGLAAARLAGDALVVLVETCPEANAVAVTLGPMRLCR